MCGLTSKLNGVRSGVTINSLEKQNNKKTVTNTLWSNNKTECNKQKHEWNKTAECITIKLNAITEQPGGDNVARKQKE